jgi:hypothetical protein
VVDVHISGGLGGSVAVPMTTILRVRAPDPEDVASSLGIGDCGANSTWDLLHRAQEEISSGVYISGGLGAGGADDGYA